jgi:hypothetical protein
MIKRYWIASLAIMLAVPIGLASARPIAYADTTTVMGEWSRGAREASVFHAPDHFWSFGAVHRMVNDPASSRQYQLDVLRGNWLARRWNLPGAQGNAYIWGGIGRGREQGSSDTAANVGFQLDYETLWFYSMLKSDAYRSAAFTQRTDTLQLGGALYAHRWDELATWVIVQAKRNHGDFAGHTETAVLLRLFKRTQWVEAGITDDGGFTFMLMLNF